MELWDIIPPFLQVCALPHVPVCTLHSTGTSSNQTGTGVNQASLRRRYRLRGTAASRSQRWALWGAAPQTALCTPRSPPDREWHVWPFVFTEVPVCSWV